MILGCISHYETNKQNLQFDFFFSSQGAMSSGGLATVWFMGKEEPRVLGREGCVNLGSPLSGIQPGRLLPPQMNVVQTLKESALVSAWHCPRYNLLKVHLCCSRVALWPLCSFRPLKASSLFLWLPPPRYCFWSLRDLNCVLWRSCIFGALWGNIQIFSFALKPMSDLG